MKIGQLSKVWARRSVCSANVETKVSQKLNLWRNWPITIRKHELSSPQSSPVSRKNWVSAVHRPYGAMLPGQDQPSEKQSRPRAMEDQHLYSPSPY